MKPAAWAGLCTALMLVVIVTALVAFRYANLAAYAAATAAPRGAALDGRRVASVYLRDGFGNQLFQVAALLGYCDRHGLQPVLDLTLVSVNSYRHDRALCTDWYTDLAYAPIPRVRVPVAEDAHALPPPPDSTPVLSGWFQDRAALPSLDVLRRHIRVPPVLADQVRTRWADALAHPHAVAIHIRRGDYTTLRAKYLMDSKEAYYRDALAAVALRLDLASTASPAPLLVVSDDLAWCRAYFSASPPPGFEPVYVSSASAQEDLAVLCAARRHILSNSTFGWWGAVLADSELVVVPTPWTSDCDGVSLYAPDWIQIPVGT